MNKTLLCTCLCFTILQAFSQEESSDSSKNLSEIFVKAYEQNRQLKQTSAERDNLKQLVQQERQRADNYQQQLTVIVKSLYQWKKNKVLSETKINYYQQLEKEQEAQIEQPPFKPSNK